jgi:hypothetical protein
MPTSSLDYCPPKKCNVNNLLGLNVEFALPTSHMRDYFNSNTKPPSKTIFKTNAYEIRK